VIKKVGCWSAVALTLITMVAILAPVFVSARAAADTSVRISRIKDLAVAISEYAADNGDHLPSKGRWALSLVPYLKDKSTLVGCEDIPSADGEPCKYEFAEGASQSKQSDMDQRDQIVREQPDRNKSETYFWASLDQQTHREQIPGRLLASPSAPK